MPGLTALLVKRGDAITAEIWNALVFAVEALSVKGTRYVRLDHGPDGTKVKFKGGGGIALPSTPLRVSVGSGDDGKPALTFSKGLIGGFEPRIANVPVSTLDANGNPPALSFDPSTAIDATKGTGFVYADLSLATDYSIQKVEPIVLSAPPPATAWHGYKLLAYLQRTPAADPEGSIVALQAVFFNLGHTTSQRFGGKARHWFWAQ